MWDFMRLKANVCSMSSRLCIQSIIAIITSLSLMWRMRWRKEEMKEVNICWISTRCQVHCNYPFIPLRQVLFTIFSLLICIFAFHTGHKQQQKMPWQRSSLQAGHHGEKSNCLYRVTKEVQMDETTFKLGFVACV